MKSVLLEIFSRTLNGTESKHNIPLSIALHVILEKGEVEKSGLASRGFPSDNKLKQNKTNCDRGGWIFLSHPDTNIRLFFLLANKYCI